ncbi:hypothetical protein ACPRNU_07305 [Chromobacterium vaccinii]
MKPWLSRQAGGVRLTRYAQPSDKSRHKVVEIRCDLAEDEVLAKFDVH